MASSQSESRSSFNDITIDDAVQLFDPGLEKILSVIDVCIKKWNDIKGSFTKSNVSKCQYCEIKLKNKSSQRSQSLLLPDMNESKTFFCSQSCHMNYSKEFRDQSNYNECLYPGCIKRRYDGGFRLHDYCGKSHARMHEYMLRKAWENPQQQRSNYNKSNSYGSGSSKKKGCQQILFYNRHEPYYEFTNFADFHVNIDEKMYPTSEHYFQSQKLIETPYFDQIIRLPYPRQAFEYPRQSGVSEWVRKDWEKVKEQVMYRGLYHKFTQHEYLFFLLIDTRNAELIEDSPHDSYWGCGPDHKGRNRLGVLLMKLRKHLQDQLNKKVSHYQISSVDSATGERDDNQERREAERKEKERQEEEERREEERREKGREEERKREERKEIEKREDEKRREEERREEETRQRERDGGASNIQTDHNNSSTNSIVSNENDGTINNNNVSSDNPPPAKLPLCLPGTEDAPMTQGAPVDTQSCEIGKLIDIDDMEVDDPQQDNANAQLPQQKTTQSLAQDTIQVIPQQHDAPLLVPMQVGLYPRLYPRLEVEIHTNPASLTPVVSHTSQQPSPSISTSCSDEEERMETETNNDDGPSNVSGGPITLV